MTTSGGPLRADTEHRKEGGREGRHQGLRQRGGGLHMGQNGLQDPRELVMTGPLQRGDTESSLAVNSAHKSL